MSSSAVAAARLPTGFDNVFSVFHRALHWISVCRADPQSLGLELAEHGVRVNAVCPGNLLDSPLWVNSLYKQYAKKWGITEEEVRQKYIDQVPMKRGCTYDDVANVVVFLASDRLSGHISGELITVSGGMEGRLLHAPQDIDLETA